MEKEVYAVDIDEQRGLIGYGGGNNAVEVYNYRDDAPVYTMSDFPESVIYIKFLRDGRCLAVALDGTIVLSTLSGDSTVVCVEEDVATAYFNEKLVVGAESGRVYLYSECLEHINTFGGHKSPIISVDYRDGRVYSASSSNLLVHDEHGRCLCLLKAHDATSFCIIGGDVLCLGREARAQIFKDTHKLFELPSDFPIDTVERVGNNVVLGGSFDYLVLIDTTFRYATYKLDTGVAALKIKAVDENTVVFSTNSGQVGLLDIRDIKSLRLFESHVGVVFDFSVADRKIVVGGEEGTALVDLDGNCLFYATTDGHTKKGDMTDRENATSNTSDCDIEDSSQVPNTAQ